MPNYPAINPSDLGEIHVSVPSNPEQQKIADCLTSLDDLIRAEGERLEALKAHKRGLMQQLFPRPGETTPRLRFPEFHDAGPWEVKRLGEVYRFKPTNSWPRDRLNYESGTTRNIHYGDIHKGLCNSFRLSEETVPFLDDGLADRLASDAFCEPGDVILADASEDLADIGKAIEVVEINGERLVSGLHTILASPIERRLIVGFAACLFASSAVRKQIQERAQGAKVLGLSKSQLSEVLLAYPRQESEQQKIADCLTSLDDLIRAEGERLEALKAHKRGLMQQLFPQSAA
ncbi:MAG: restriction endonuclease subunit S [Allosphingosinicella sp.]|uniref:restriction endonuclease subunit S n=1 Tax=Allosphingosinicella sp. TaxID=2823234 RepID=UPI003926543C